MPPPSAIPPRPAILRRDAVEHATQYAEKQLSADWDRDPSPPKKKGKGGRVFRVICLILVCALIGGVTGAYVSQRIMTGLEDEIMTTIQNFQPPPMPTPLPTPDPTPDPTPATPVRDGDRLTAEDIYTLGRGQVVGITAEIVRTNAFGQATTAQVSGSGFIISPEGYILTNYHVIEDATRIMVMLSDYSRHEARFVGGESITSDMAVLKIDATGLGLSVADIGNSSQLRVGASIYAIGNPLGELTHTITAGIVSALGREVAIAQGQSLTMFQIDAAVNTGNSGGPVYNEQGEVVGIVTAKAAMPAVEGIGFAIPIDDAMRYANFLIERGYIPRPHLGIYPVTVTESYAENFSTVLGVFVNTVHPGSAAERGGVLVGDVITAFDGRPIFTVEQLRAALSGFAPGDTVQLTIFRDGEHRTLSVTLGDRPPEASE